MAPWQTSPLCMTSSQGVPGALHSSTLRTETMLMRQRNEPMAWSWMVVGSGWTFPSLNDLTPPLLESTWAGPHMVEEAQVVHAAVHVTMTEDMTVGMTEEVMTATRTGTTIDHTEGDLRHRTTEELTGLAPDHGLTLHVVIEAPPVPKLRPDVFLICMIVCRVDLFSLKVKVTPLFTCVCEQLMYLGIG